MNHADTQSTLTDRERLVNLVRENGSPVMWDQARDFALASLGRGHSMQRQSAVFCNEQFDVAALQQAIGAVAENEPLLRSRFLGVGGKLVTLQRDTQPSNLRIVRVNRDHDTLRALDDELRTAIDISRSPGLRVVLVRSGSRDTLVATMSALIADEWTPALLLDRIVAVYLGKAEEEEPSPSMRELLASERALLGTTDLEQVLASVKADLSEVAGLDLSTKPRPQVLTQTRAGLERPLGKNQSFNTGEFASTAAVAWVAVLARLSHERRFGLLMKSRPDAQRGVLGPLAHTSVLPVDVDVLETVVDLRDAIRNHQLSPANDLHVPFAAVVDAVNPGRDMSRTPLAQAAFVDLTSLGPTSAERRVGAGANVVDLTLIASEDSRGSVLGLEYNHDLFHSKFAATLLERVAAAISQISANPELRLGDVEVLLDGELNEVVELGRGEVHELTGSRTIAGPIFVQARDNSDEVAVRFADNSFTYRELMNATREIGALLDNESRPASNGPVALLMDRSPLQIAAMLACCWRGVPFLPIDLNYPVERQLYMALDSGAQTIILDGSCPAPTGAEDLTALSADMRMFDAAGPMLAAPTAAPDDAAYIIYTSGSTGRPKAVQVSNRSVANNLTWRQRVFPVSAGDAVLQNHSFSFDPSVWATFWPLWVGGRIVLTEGGGGFDPSAFIDLVASESVAVVGGVPSVLSVLADEPRYSDCSALKYVLSGAEVLTADLVDRLSRLPQVTVANLYGPTEATIDASYWIHEGGKLDAGAPIGRPVDNCQIFLMDDLDRPVPPGAIGEICIGGASLADGYLNAVEETSRRFFQWHGPQAEMRLYRTGDLGQWDESGHLKFRGRSDDQVKVRGFRVELGEIEATALGLSDIADFVAVASRITPGRPEMRISAYFTLTPGAQSDATAVRAALAGTLPAHMVPSTLEVLDTIPTLPSGKADRALLRRRRPVPVTPTDPDDGEDGPLLTDVRKEFANALGLERMGADIDFFEMGGTSIMLATLAGKLRMKYENDLPIHQFFQLPTARGVANVIDELRQGGIDQMLARRHMDTMNSEAELASTIEAGSLPWGNVDQPRQILLTGATGYLGSYLLSALLRKTDATISCLVRGRDANDSRDRLVDSLTKYDLWREEDESRIRVLCGDLGQPNFGLGPETWQALAADIDAIFHNGALVNFVYPYSALRQANVEGTRRVLELATTTTVKAVHHISTIDSLLATHTPRPFVEDDAPLENPVGVPGGYTGTKWVAEKLMNVARKRGLPVSIYRPGLILGTTDTGVTQTSDYLLVALKGFLPMGIVPEYPRIFDTVPVDYVGNAVVEIASRPASRGRFFHFFNPDPVSIRQFCEWIQEFGFSFDIVPFEEARRQALGVEEGHPLYSLVPLIRDAEVDPQPSLDPRLIDQLQPTVECANTLTFLEGSGISCPPMTREFAWQCMQYLVDVGYLPHPATRGNATEPAS
jgi:myxalamid-type nonribosomal peptide synthetase MxaA